MTLRFVELRKTGRDGEVEIVPFDRHVTTIVGSRNTSKTTTLRMIDFCLGDGDSAAEALGGPVAEAYAALALDLEIRGEAYTIRRPLITSEGHLTKIEADDLEFSTREFQRWIMEKLGWPELSVPKGRAYRSASDVVPVTFRTLLRHIYRKEASWLDFAAREEEFLRRAVTAFFLGIADTRYAVSMLEFSIGETGREIDSLEARRREVVEQGDSLTEQLGRAIGLEGLTLARLDTLSEELESRRGELHHRRSTILSTVRSTEGFVAEPGERFQVVQQQIEELGTTAGDLRRTAAGYAEALRDLQAQVLRLERAETAVDVFTQLPVHLCPACGQGVTPRASGPECYLCGQLTAPDTRARRIDLEIAALRRESGEIEEVLRETLAQIDQLEAQLGDLGMERDELRDRLDRERADFIAPYLTEVEELNLMLGSAHQQLATIEGLRSLNERIASIDEELNSVRARLDEQTSDVARLESRRVSEDERASEFASLMTDFLNGLTAERWQFGPVTIASADLTFYLGPQRWDVALGAESKVLFFLSYTNALLRLSELGEGVHAPGTAILDNPLQQGISDDIVREALGHLAESARALDHQLIVTLPRDLDMAAEGAVIHFDRQFAP